MNVKALDIREEISTQSKDVSDNNSFRIQNWVHAENDDDDEVIPDSFQSHDNEVSNMEGDANKANYVEKTQEQPDDPSEDSFGLEDLILKSSKKCTKVAQETNSNEPKFLSGFTPLTLNHPENMATKGYMAGIINRWHGEVIVMWDFNKVVILLSGRINMRIIGRLSSKSLMWTMVLFLFVFSFMVLEQDFSFIIEDSWNNDGVYTSNTMVLLENKLKCLKQRLKMWSNDKNIMKHDCKALQDSLIDLDLLFDKEKGLPDDVSTCTKLLPDLQVIDQKVSANLAQKEKIKWAIEGDEKSKFFHGIVNKKKRHIAIKGVLIDGEWIDNPSRVKYEFYNHFKNKISAPDWTRAPFEEMDLLSFIRTADPTKVRIGERQRDEDEPKLLETTVGRGSGEQAEQGDFASGGHGVGIDVVAETVVEDVATAQLKRQKKRKTKVADAGEPSHPAKKLRDDYGALGGPTVGGKSQSSIQRLLAGAVQNAKDGDHTELLAGANLRAIGAPQRFVIFSDSSDHLGVNIAKAEVDSVVRTSMLIITSATTTTPTADPAAIAKEKLVGSSVFGADSPFAGESHPISSGFSDCSGSDFLVGGIRTMVDEFSPPKIFASIRGMDHDQLFTEFNVGAARQISLTAEVRMRAEYHVKEKRRLKAVVDEKNQVLKARDEEIENLTAQLLLKEAEAAKAIRLRA
nr:RNA-directed DNA polymerase, eukaryota [Tanacetum cinerariifolium]